MTSRRATTVRTALAVLIPVLLTIPLSPFSIATSQDDAGSGGDAGDTFGTATLILQNAAYEGQLDRAAGDRHDFYKVYVPEGGYLTIAVRPLGSPQVVEPVTLLDPNGVPVDATAGALGVGTSFLEVRVNLHRALVGGYYRLHLQSEASDLGAYALCVGACEGPRDAPIDVGPSYWRTDVKVVIIPPTHGDLGNPFGPTAKDYLEATLRGIRAWELAIDAFTADFPEYDYLQQIEVDIEVHDGVSPIDWDAIVVAYIETSGPVFRGLAGTPGGPIVLSLFAYAPRAGQTLPDYPEVNDLEAVTMHEFSHAFGIGHTRTWTAAHGPDLMNSPYALVYGDGSPIGDGGERTTLQCISSLDLYGLAYVYQWLPSGVYTAVPRGFVSSPLPYKLYCVNPDGSILPPI